MYFGVFAVGLAGCGNLPVFKRAENQEFINDGDGTEKEKSFLLAERSVDENGEETVRMHKVSSYSSFDAFGGGSASFSGDTVVVAGYSSNYSTWIDDKGKIRFSINLYFSGLFVPEDEILTEEMEKLVNERLMVSGCQGLNSWDLHPPVPGCENGVIFNILTGEPCYADYNRDPNLVLTWQSDSQFGENHCTPPVDLPNFCDQFPPFYDYSNFSVKIYGGIITAVGISMEENVWEDSAPQPEWWRPWNGQVSFQGVITADYAPEPDEYLPSCGGGRG